MSEKGSNQPRPASNDESAPQSALLRLPPELRLIIYDHAIPNFDPTTEADGQSVCTLLHICRLVRSESHGLLVKALETAERRHEAMTSAQVDAVCSLWKAKDLEGAYRAEREYWL